MNTKIIGIILAVLGALALAYGSFTYVKSVDKAKVGPFEFSIKNKETVNVPVWAGVGALLVGGILLVVDRKKLA